jgi:hypothetical protein
MPREGVYMSDEFTWVQAILLVLRERGGEASLQEIYRRVSAYKPLDKGRRAAPQETAGGRPSFHQIVRATLSNMPEDVLVKGKATYSLGPAGWEQLDSILATTFAFPEAYRGVRVLTEGAVHRVLVNAYERNPEVRRQCIEYHGTACCICGMDFGSVYGALAEGFIHVHHLKPLSQIGEEYKPDPVADLRPVCPNCHAVIHLDGECREIEEVKQFMHGQRAA